MGEKLNKNIFVVSVPKYDWTKIIKEKEEQLNREFLFEKVMSISKKYEANV